MATKKHFAVSVQAEVVMAYCPCGGEAIDDRTGSAELEAAQQQVLAARAKLTQALANAFVLGARVPIGELRKLVLEEAK